MRLRLVEPLTQLQSQQSAEIQFRGFRNQGIRRLEQVDYIDIIREIKRATRSHSLIINIPYWLFHVLLATWALFDHDPPFTTQQLSALVARDEFEVIDWPAIFGTTPTPFAKAINETFNDPTYSKVVLEF